jgi:hypothetical protein
MIGQPLRYVVMRIDVKQKLVDNLRSPNIGETLPKF